MALDIFWSPSSQHANLYAYGNTNEEVVCNKIVDRADYHAKRHGYTTARNNPGEVYWQHRDRSNALKPRYHITPHTNAGGGLGTYMYCFRPDDRERLSTKLSINILNEINAISLGPIRELDKALKQGTFDEIVKVDAAVAYPEIDFHDNAERAKWILEHIEEIAIALVKGILKTDGKAWIPEVFEAELPEPDWEGQLKEKDTTIADLQARLASLTGELSNVRGELIGTQGVSEQRLRELVEIAAAQRTLDSIKTRY